MGQNTRVHNKFSFWFAWCFRWRLDKRTGMWYDNRKCRWWFLVSIYALFTDFLFPWLYKICILYNCGANSRKNCNRKYFTLFWTECQVNRKNQRFSPLIFPPDIFVWLLRRRADAARTCCARAPFWPRCTTHGPRAVIFPWRPYVPCFCWSGIFQP